MREVSKLALAVLPTFFIAACGSHPVHVVGREPPVGYGATTSTVAAADPRTTTYAVCRVYSQSNSVDMQFSGLGAAALCDEWISSSARGGDFWSRHPNHADSLDESAVLSGSPVCELLSGSASVSIYDTGGQTMGQEACSTLIAQGWREVGQ